MLRLSHAGGEPMRRLLSGFFTSVVTIVRATTETDDYGEPIKTWSPVIDLLEIPAMIAGGDVSVRMKKQEFRTSQNVHEMVYRRVLLSGCYPEIGHEDRARFEDKDWAIVSTVVDVTATWTELLCESIDPGNI